MALRKKQAQDDGETSATGSDVQSPLIKKSSRKKKKLIVSSPVVKYKLKKDLKSKKTKLNSKILKSRIKSSKRLAIKKRENDIKQKAKEEIRPKRKYIKKKSYEQNELYKKDDIGLKTRKFRKTKMNVTNDTDSDKKQTPKKAKFKIEKETNEKSKYSIDSKESIDNKVTDETEAKSRSRRKTLAGKITNESILTEIKKEPMICDEPQNEFDMSIEIKKEIIDEEIMMSQQQPVMQLTAKRRKKISEEIRIAKMRLGKRRQRLMNIIKKVTCYDNEAKHIIDKFGLNIMQEDFFGNNLKSEKKQRRHSICSDTKALKMFPVKFKETRDKELNSSINLFNSKIKFISKNSSNSKIIVQNPYSTRPKNAEPSRILRNIKQRHGKRARSQHPRSNSREGSDISKISGYESESSYCESTNSGFDNSTDNVEEFNKKRKLEKIIDSDNNNKKIVLKTDNGELTEIAEEIINSASDTVPEKLLILDQMAQNFNETEIKPFECKRKKKDFDEDGIMAVKFYGKTDDNSGNNVVIESNSSKFENSNCLIDELTKPEENENVDSNPSDVKNEVKKIKRNPDDLVLSKSELKKINKQKATTIFLKNLEAQKSSEDLIKVVKEKFETTQSGAIQINLEIKPVIIQQKEGKSKIIDTQQSSTDQVQMEIKTLENTTGQQKVERVKILEQKVENKVTQQKTEITANENDQIKRVPVVNTVTPPKNDFLEDIEEDMQVHIISKIQSQNESTTKTEQKETLPEFVDIEVLNKGAKDETKENVSPFLNKSKASDEEKIQLLGINDTPENLKKKLTILNAVGLQSLQAAAEAKLAKHKKLFSKNDPFSGTLKTIIKINKNIEKKAAKNQDRKTSGDLKMKFNKSKNRNGIANGEYTTEVSGMSANGKVFNPFCNKLKDNLNSQTSNGEMWNVTMVDDSGNQQLFSDSVGGQKKTNYPSNRSNTDESSSEDDASLSSDEEESKGQKEEGGILIIPEKSSSFSIHPQRLCTDECSYCYGKFGLFDTPLHIAQIKSTDRQKKILENEKQITLDSCLCDACYRHLDRKANAATYNKANNKKNLSVSTISATNGNTSQLEHRTCNVLDCHNISTHHVRRKWVLRLKRNLNQRFQFNIDPNVHNVPICETHYEELERLMTCAMCKRRLARSHANNLSPNEIPLLNEAFEKYSLPIKIAEASSSISPNSSSISSNDTPSMDEKAKIDKEPLEEGEVRVYDISNESGLQTTAGTESNSSNVYISRSNIVCKLCRYFSSLLLKPHTFARSHQVQFFKNYRRRLLHFHSGKSLDEIEEEEEKEETDLMFQEQQREKDKSVTANLRRQKTKKFQNKQFKTGNLTFMVSPGQDPLQIPPEEKDKTYMELAKEKSTLGTLSSNQVYDVITIDDETSPQKKQPISIMDMKNNQYKLNLDQLQAAKKYIMDQKDQKFGLDAKTKFALDNLNPALQIRRQPIVVKQQETQDKKTAVEKLDLNPSISVRQLLPGEDSLPLQGCVEFNNVKERTPEGWEKSYMIVQYDSDTKKLWQELQKPYGNQSSFLRHLVLLEKYFRQGDLILANNASHSATNYCESVQNRLRAYDNIPSLVPPLSLLNLHPSIRQNLQMNFIKKMSEKNVTVTKTPTMMTPKPVVSNANPPGLISLVPSSSTTNNSSAATASTSASATTTINKNFTRQPQNNKNKSVMLNESVSITKKSSNPTSNPNTQTTTSFKPRLEVKQTTANMVQLKSGANSFQLSLQDYNRMCQIKREAERKRKKSSVGSIITSRSLVNNITPSSGSLTINKRVVSPAIIEAQVDNKISKDNATMDKIISETNKNLYEVIKLSDNSEITICRTSKMNKSTKSQQQILQNGSEGNKLQNGGGGNNKMVLQNGNENCDIIENGANKNTFTNNNVTNAIILPKIPKSLTVIPKSVRRTTLETPHSQGPNNNTTAEPISLKDIRFQNISLNKLANLSLNKIQGISLNKFQQDISLNKSSSSSDNNSQNKLQDVSLNKLVEVSLNKISTDGISPSKLQDVSLNNLQEVSLNKLQDISLNKLQEVSLNKLQDVSLNKLQDVSLNNLQEVSLNKLQDISLNKLQNISLNNLQEVSLNKLQDVSLNKLHDVSLNKLQDVSKNNLQEVSLNNQEISLNKLQDVSLNSSQDVSLNKSVEISIKNVSNNKLAEVKADVNSETASKKEITNSS